MTDEMLFKEESYRIIGACFCYDQIIVELKAAKALADDHRAQTINYLKATRQRLGLLVNFGHYPKLESERLVK